MRGITNQCTYTGMMNVQCVLPCLGSPMALLSADVRGLTTDRLRVVDWLGSASFKKHSCAVLCKPF
jgi:hypothetical protein